MASKTNTPMHEMRHRRTDDMSDSPTTLADENTLANACDSADKMWEEDNPAENSEEQPQLPSNPVSKSSRKCNTEWMSMSLASMSRALFRVCLTSAVVIIALSICLAQVKNVEGQRNPQNQDEKIPNGQ